MNQHNSSIPDSAEHFNLPPGFNAPDEYQESYVDGVLSPVDMILFARERWNSGDCDRWPNIAQAILDAWDAAARAVEDPDPTELDLCGMAQLLGCDPSRLWALAHAGVFESTYRDGELMFDVKQTRRRQVDLIRRGCGRGDEQ